MSSFPSIIPSDPNPILAQVPSVIAGFWRRLVAAVIDVLLVGVAGFILGLIFFDFFMRLGEWGPLAGFVLSLPYYCVLNSFLGGGQTIGKRLLGVRVVNATGASISPARAAGRYAALSLPIFLNGISLPASMSGSPADTAVEFIVFAAGGAIIYLYVFNRASRQSLHDLIAGTYVIDSATRGKVGVRPIWKGHAIVLSALLLAAVGIAKVVQIRLARSPQFSAMLSLVQKLTNSHKVYGVSVMKMEGWGTAGKSHTLQVQTRWRGRPVDPAGATTEVASMVLENAPDILGQDALVVTVTYGFDIGIASGWRSYTYRGTLAEWKKKINQSKNQSTDTQRDVTQMQSNPPPSLAPGGPASVSRKGTMG